MLTGDSIMFFSRYFKMKILIYLLVLIVYIFLCFFLIEYNFTSEKEMECICLKTKKCVYICTRPSVKNYFGKKNTKK